MRAILILLFWVVPGIFVSAVAGVPDSLQTLINQSQCDTQKVNLNVKLAHYYRFSNPDSALAILKSAEQLAEKEAYASGNYAISLERGLILTAMGRFAEAETALEFARDGFKQIGETWNLGKSLNKLGILYFYQGNYPRAIDQYEQALEYLHGPKAVGTCQNNLALAREANGDLRGALEAMFGAVEQFKLLDDSRRISFAFGNLSTFYRKLEEFDNAIKYARNSLEVLPESSDPESKASATAQLGLAEEMAGNYAAALSGYQESLAIAREAGLLQEQALALNNIANLYSKKGENRKAEERYREAFEIYVQIGIKKKQAVILSNLASLKLEENQPGEAIDLLEKAKELAETDGDLPHLTTIYKNLAAVYESNGQPEEALRYQKLYANAQDSLLDETKVKEMAALQAKFEEEQRLQNAQLEAATGKRRGMVWLIVSVIAGLLILAVIIGLILGRSVKKLKHENFNLSLSLAEMNGRLTEAQRETTQSAPSPAAAKLPPHFDSLSKREIEVFLCLANGLSNKAIADELHVSVDTVRTHAKSIYSKLGLRNRAMVIKMAHEYRIS